MPKSMALRSEMNYGCAAPSGNKFNDLKNKLSKEPGVKNPGGLAAALGRKKAAKGGK